jgi:hypothetical protein
MNEPICFYTETHKRAGGYVTVQGWQVYLRSVGVLHIIATERGASEYSTARENVLLPHNTSLAQASRMAIKTFDDLRAGLENE